MRTGAEEEQYPCKQDIDALSNRTSVVKEFFIKSETHTAKLFLS